MVEIAIFYLVFLLSLLAVAALSEEESIEAFADRHTVNRLADRSRRRKPERRRTGKYSKAGIQ